MADPLPLPLHGRGAAGNLPNRFERLAVSPDIDAPGAGAIDASGDEAEAGRGPSTQFLKDASRTVIAQNNSPDVGFQFSVNPYRGCEHGCIYCYARPTHEYLGFSAGLDFESRIMVKTEAATLLRKELSARGWKPAVLAMSGVTDCYQPIERKLELTRRCLEVLAKFRSPVVIITKNHLVTRDIDLLGELAKCAAAAVMVSVTSLDPELTAKMEPRTSVPRRRLEAIGALANAGIPVGVMVAPVVPGLTDHEMPGILAAAASAGARCAAFTPVRLPLAVAPLFERWIQQHFPDRAGKVLNRIRSLRGGKLNDAQFGSRMRGQGVFADQLQTMFRLARRRAGLDGPFPSLSTDHFRVPGPQLQLFDG